jgi:SAM-dependent methyltransferase
MNCPLCSSNRVKLLRCPFPNVFHCGSCSFIFADQSVDSSSSSLYDEAWSQTEVQPTYSFTNGSYVIRNEPKMQLLLDRLEGFRKVNRLLDVGCSAAFFLKLASDRQWDVQGVEVSDFGVNFSREHLKIPVFQGLLQDAHFAGDSFDVVCSSHVIEHVRDPVSLLKEMKRILRPGGSLVTVVPTQFAAPSYRFFGKWTGEGPPRHVSFFTRRLFEDTVRHLGFTVCYSRQNVEFQKILSILRRGKDQATDQGNETSEPPSQANRPLLQAAKSVINRVATGLGVGDELTTIAVK